MSPPPTLTPHLLTAHRTPLHHSTTTPFLTHAGAGTLPNIHLTHWLTQDTYYTRAYVRFLGSLLSALHLPFSMHDTLELKIFNLLTSALVNVQREMHFFEDVAQRYDIKLADAGADEATKKYVALFDAVGSAARTSKEGLLKGLVLLWGTELTYLLSWHHARAHIPPPSSSSSSSSSPDTNAPTRALHMEFIPNWTSPAFEAFVDNCREIVDDLASELGTMALDADAGGRRDCEEVFGAVVRLEGEFWPEVEVEV